jgi:hypothetical protein
MSRATNIHRSDDPKPPLHVLQARDQRRQQAAQGPVDQLENPILQRAIKAARATRTPKRPSSREANDIAEKRPNVFSDNDLALISKLAREGHNGVSIGAIVGRSPGSIRAVCANRLNISLKPARPKNSYRFGIADDDVPLACEAAAEYGMTPNNLSRKILHVVYALRLVHEVLDTPRAKALFSRASRGTPGTKLDGRCEGDESANGRGTVSPVKPVMPPAIPLHVLQPMLSGTLDAA